MDITQLLTKIYFDSGDTHKHIISFYEKEGVTDITVEKFVSICTKHLIISEPSVMFKFFDFMDIKIAIIPVINSNEWSYRIFYDTSKISIANDFSSRGEATIKAIECASNIYFKKLKRTEVSGD